MFVASLYQESPVIVELGDVIRHFSLPTNSDVSSETNGGGGGGGDKQNSSKYSISYPQNIDFIHLYLFNRSDGPDNRQ